MPYTRVAVAQIERPAVELEIRADLAPGVAGGSLTDPYYRKLLDEYEAARVEITGRIPELLAYRAARDLGAVIEFCRRRRVDILVFPEGAIERNWLPDIMRANANTGPVTDLGMPVPVVVGGTHLYNPNGNHDEYGACKLEPPTDWADATVSFYVAPVLLWDEQGTLQGGRLVPKRTRSRLQRRGNPYPYPGSWDPFVAVQLPAREERPAASVTLCVLTCSDFIRTDPNCILDAGRSPQLVIVPARTPTHTIRDDFLATARRYQRRGVPTAIANTAEPNAGHSLIYATVPRPYYKTTWVFSNSKPLGSLIHPVPQGNAAVTILAIDLGHKGRQWDGNAKPAQKVTVAPIISRREFPELFGDNYFSALATIRIPVRW